jgi:hypothetical protein
MRGIEALFDAIQYVEGHEPGDISKRNRNPGNLRGSSLPHTIDSGGYCVFPSILEGTQALLLDLRAKLGGSHGLKPESTLDDLFDVYAPRVDKNDPSAYAITVAQWCSKAIGKQITHSSTLKEVCPEFYQ